MKFDVHGVEYGMDESEHNPFDINYDLAETPNKNLTDKSEYSDLEDDDAASTTVQQDIVPLYNDGPEETEQVKNSSDILMVLDT